MSKAFSLVELSIVLVILGLLVGGVLSGQALINAAKLRSISNEQSTYVTAIQSFKGKYLALPGDLNNATQFWTSAGGDNLITGSCANAIKVSAYDVAINRTCNGNADGTIGVISGDAAQGAIWQIYGNPTYEESHLAWNHLGLAGLITGKYVGITTPPTPAGPSGSYAKVGIDLPATKSFPNAGWMLTNLCTTDGMIFAGTCGHVLQFGGSLNGDFANWRDWPAYPVITTTDAANIDQKMDDGKPGTGAVRTWTNGSSYVPDCATTTNAVTAQYATALNDQSCSLIFTVRL